MSSEDLSSPYNTGFLNEKNGSLSSISIRLSGDKLNDFLANLETALNGKGDKDGIQLTYSLKTTNEGKSFFGGAFVKTYLDDYKPKGEGNSGGGGWKAKSYASKEKSRIKEHSIDGGSNEGQEMAASSTGRASRFSR